MSQGLAKACDQNTIQDKLCAYFLAPVSQLAGHPVAGICDIHGTEWTHSQVLPLSQEAWQKVLELLTRSRRPAELEKHEDRASVFRRTQAEVWGT